jgi:predicted enzyme related to lactoylglutathione lyase
LFDVINYSAGLVTIATPDFDRSWKFYVHLLNQQPRPFMPHVYAEFRLPGIVLGIFRPQTPSDFGTGAGAMSLCLEVADVELALSQVMPLASQPLVDIMTASHGREAYIYDPDGNRIILHQSINTVMP